MGSIKLSEFKFSEILIFAWKLKYYHWEPTLSMVFLEVTGSLCSFFRNYLPRLHNYSLSLSCPKLKSRSMGKVANSAHNANIYKSAFLWDNRVLLNVVRAFCLLPICHIECQKDKYSELRCNEISNYTHSSGTFKNETGVKAKQNRINKTLLVQDGKEYSN